VALVHGEPEPMKTLAQRLRSLKAPVHIPDRNERLDLTRLSEKYKH